MTTIEYTPRGRNAYGCVLTAPSGDELVVEGSIAQDGGEAKEHGDEPLLGNPTVLMNLHAYARHEAMYRRLRAEEKRESHKRQAARHRRDAVAVSDMVGRLGVRTRAGWCSGCFARSEHRHVRGMSRPVATYLCVECGAPTTPCAVPRCDNLANRGTRSVASPRYCAEHRHDIPSFENMGQRLASLDDYAEWLEFEKPNVARVTRIASVAVIAGVALTPAALAAAPAIGGATGTLTGLSGAAATGHGLAMWGGGSLAAGGLGMAGGTTVITALGGSLGGVMGAAVTSAYVRADSSFKIERLRDGEGPAVLFASGFLSDGKDDGWGPWREIVDERYPDAPVYRVHWGAKELKALGLQFGRATTQQVVRRSVRKMATSASRKAAGRLGPLGPLLAVGGIAANPWTVARSRAEMTGAALADIIARTDDQSFVLIGHSLGGRVMVTAARTLGTKGGEHPRIQAMHLLGAAVGIRGDWSSLDLAVSDVVWNYWSRNDGVLAHLYRSAELGSRAVGHVGFQSKFAKVKDRNVTRQVASHSEYVKRVTLR